jgi:hypothetical protein
MVSISRIATFAAVTASAVILALPVSAQAQTVVQFNGIVVPVCILTVNTSGVLAMSTAGTELGSEQTGGVAAVLGVVSTGGAPTLLFTAPTMSIKPVTYAGTPALSLKYTSSGGANQAYTSAASQHTSTNPLGDTVTLNAKAIDSTGFTAGSYRLQTTATCQQ